MIVHVAEALGGEVESVEITDLQEQTYFARLKIRKDDKLVEIDARPSDAIAIAVTFQPPLPIYVAEEVLAKASGKS